MQGSRRGKKLNVKAALQIIREKDIDISETYDLAQEHSTSGLPKFESGVESKEEKVSHVLFISFVFRLLPQ